MSHPRDYALCRLDAEELPGFRANTLRAVKLYEQGARDADFSEQLYLGTVKHLLHLQWLIQHYSGRTLKQIDLPVQKVLALALYQIRFLHRVPHAIAVDEAVEQTRRFKLGKADAFVNAVLRKATREQPTGLPTEATPTDYAQHVLSMPADTFAQLAAAHGGFSALQISKHALVESPLLLRLFPGVTIDQLRSAAPPAVKILGHTQPGFAVAEDARRNQIAEWHAAKLAQPQDPTAAEVVDHMQLEPGQSVLDRCCGVGTKTIQMASKLPGAMNIWAIDNAERRTTVLEESVAKLQLTGVRVHCSATIPTGGDTPSLFDRALLDVPCSNSGVLARRAEAKYRQSKVALGRLSELQTKLLADTLKRIRPGGILVYSTCSIWPQENEHVVQAVISEGQPRCELLEQRVTLPAGIDVAGHVVPAQYRDGGYFAVIRRVE